MTKGKFIYLFLAGFMYSGSLFAAIPENLKNFAYVKEGKNLKEAIPVCCSSPEYFCIQALTDSAASCDKNNWMCFGGMDSNYNCTGSPSIWQWFSIGTCSAADPGPVPNCNSYQKKAPSEKKSKK